MCNVSARGPIMFQASQNTTPPPPSTGYNIDYLIQGGGGGAASGAGDITTPHYWDEATQSWIARS